MIPIYHYSNLDAVRIDLAFITDSETPLNSIQLLRVSGVSEFSGAVKVNWIMMWTNWVSYIEAVTCKIHLLDHNVWPS